MTKKIFEVYETKKNSQQLNKFNNKWKCCILESAIAQVFGTHLIIDMGDQMINSGRFQENILLNYWWDNHIIYPMSYIDK